MMYDSSDLPCALFSSEAQEVGQESAGAHMGADVDPTLVERLLALCEAVSHFTERTYSGVVAKIGDEARAIMAAMKLGETDSTVAQRIWQEWDGEPMGVKEAIAEAIAAGRQLEREGR